MRTRLVTVTLLVVSLTTLALTASVTDPTSPDEEEFDDDLPSNRTSEDYDEEGELLTTTTRGDRTLDDGTGIDSYPNFEAEEDGEEVSTSETKVEESKSKRIPEVGDEEECGEPPSKENARIERGKKSRYFVGDIVYYSCQFGYVTDGFERTAQCYLSETTDTLQWRQPNIVCNPRSCGDPGYVLNGERVGSVFTFPNRISFECDEGFVMKGNAHRYCKTTGTWSGQLPTCEKIMCDPPQSPINGKVSFDSLEFGSEVRYTCNEGFLLRTDHTRICSANGTWSGDDPICEEAQCESPVAPDFGTVQVVGGKSSVGSMAIYTCEGDRFLVGSSTSKCLDIGEWTFPTPKCRDACSVPKVPHGKIGRYVLKYRGKTFKNMEVGDKIEEGLDLYLICDRYYEPFGTTNMEEKITCSRGEWSRYPRCEPANCTSDSPTIANGEVIPNFSRLHTSEVTYEWDEHYILKNSAFRVQCDFAACRLPPTRTPNADKMSYNSTHGFGVTYFCNDYAQKTKRGNVKCHFGTWVGKTPTCKDTRCDARSLDFPGVKKGVNKRYYKQSESYTPVCEKGYSASKLNNTFICLNEEWKGHLPPCEPANCTSDPPTIANGEVVPNFSRLHTSEVTYECNEHYRLISSASKVRCDFGEWTGKPPKCHDVRCYADDLKKNLGVSKDKAMITDNGATLQVTCDEGFSPTGFQPRCEDGEWKESQPPCTENGCSIYNVNYGKITRKVNEKKCNLFGFNCRYWIEFIEVERDRFFSPGSSLYVSCVQGFTLHGKGQNNVSIKCSRGKWNPRPECLRTGMPYREEAEVFKAKSSVVERPPTEKPVHIPDRQSQSAGDSQSPVVSIDQRPPTDPPVAKDTFSVISGRKGNCSCKYSNMDPLLVGYAGTEKLRSETSIKDGCKVKFHCSPLGYYRLMGSSEIICSACRTWHSSEYPHCEGPRNGDAVVRIASSLGYEEMPGGAIGIDQGSALILTCLSNVQIRPQWRASSPPDGVLIYDQNIPENGYIVQTQVIKFNSIKPWHSATYECAVRGHRSYFIEVQVFTPDISCPMFSENEDFSVHYDRGQVFNSSAVFSCKNPSDTLVGSTILTCLMNGQWSGDPPLCVKRCPEVPVTESGLQVIYSNGQETGSTASFHCLLPSMRNGVPYTKCKKSGQWADPIPTCEVPACTLESLYGDIPESVVPILDDSSGDTVVYNTSLHLKCVDNRRVVGGDGTAKCGPEGKWIVAEVHCVSGCPPIEKTADILLDPEEEFYNVGQFVTFSCAPGQVLSSEVVRVMCLRKSMGPEWSEKIIPHCVNEPAEFDEEETYSRKKIVKPVDEISEESDESV